MKVSCGTAARSFGIIGAAFTTIGITQPNFLPIGLVFLALAAVHQWRARRGGHAYKE